MLIEVILAIKQVSFSLKLLQLHSIFLNTNLLFTDNKKMSHCEQEELLFSSSVNKRSEWTRPRQILRTTSFEEANKDFFQLLQDDLDRDERNFSIDNSNMHPQQIVEEDAIQETVICQDVECGASQPKDCSIRHLKSNMVWYASRKKLKASNGDSNQFKKWILSSSRKLCVFGVKCDDCYKYVRYNGPDEPFSLKRDSRPPQIISINEPIKDPRVFCYKGEKLAVCAKNGFYAAKVERNNEDVIVASDEGCKWKVI